MNKILCLFILLIFINNGLKAQNIKFESENIDYGIVKKGSKKERVFKFTNIGEKPIVISDVKVSCGCTVPSFPKKPILPGKSEEIKVNYDTNIVGTFNKPITIVSNDVKTPRKVLIIKGEVK